MISPLRTIGVAALLGAAIAAPATALRMPPDGVSSIGNPSTLPEYAYFKISAKGTQRTVWSGPARSGGDCSGTFSTSPQGRETVQFSTRRTPMVALRDGSSVLFHFGDWRTDLFTMGPWPAHGSTTRVDASRTTWRPGICGGSTPPPAPKEDCGRRVRHWNLTLQYLPTATAVELGFVGITRVNPKPAAALFSACPIQTPVQASPDTVTTITEPLPADDLFGGYRKLIILGRRTWRTRSPGMTATTTVRWTITLTRHAHP